MKFGQIKVIMEKEFKETLRDKRTLFVSIILPIILYPILIIGLSQISIFQVQKIQKKVFSIFISGSEYAPELAEAVLADSQFVIREGISQPLDALKKGDLHLFLEIPPGLEDSLKHEHPAGINIYYDGASEESDAGSERLGNIINAYRDEIVRNWVTEKGLNPEFIKPILKNYRNIATAKEMGAFLFGGILAFFVIIMIITGAYYCSVDMLAGEKERGTLETLMVSPAGRTEIIIGKYLTVFTMAIVTALLNLASMGLTLTHGMFLMEKMADIKFSLNFTSLASIFFILVPLAALFSALFLALSAFAKSYKEAQSYLTPLVIISELPAIVVLLPGVQLTNLMAFVPIMNVALLFKEMLMGKYILSHVVIVLCSMALYAILALAWAIRLLQREEILIGDKIQSPFKYIFRKRTLKKQLQYPGLGDSFLLFLFTLVLLWYIGQPLQLSNVFTGLLITELGLVLLPSLILVKRFGIPLGSIKLNPPSMLKLIFSIPMGVSIFYLGTQAQVYSSLVFPPPMEYIQGFNQIIARLGNLGFIPGLFVIALLPGLCEEFLFRGYIQNGIARKWGSIGGVIVTAFLFAFFHLDPFRFASVLIPGLALGFILMRSDSLPIAMATHVIVNSVAFCLSYFPIMANFELIFEDQLLQVFCTLLALAIFILFYILLNSKKKDKSDEGI